MQVGTDEWWIDEFVTAASVARAGTQTAFYRGRRAGHFVTLCRGIHMPAHVWTRMSADERFRARVHAASIGSAGQLVFSHLSAGALWRLPMVGRWPERPEIACEPAAGGRSTPGVKAYATGVPTATLLIDRVRVTGLSRTVVDVARTATLGTAVAMADAALGATQLPDQLAQFAVDKAELLGELQVGMAKTGRSKCQRVLELADGASGSPGESVSRVAMFLEGLPAPVLQHPFRDSIGLIGYVDFWWPEFSLIGEFDGLGKYTREDMLRGKSPADAVFAEKVREDRLRALGPRVVRWGWADAMSPPRLGNLLRRAGLR
jgi:hypothetical protein